MDTDVVVVDTEPDDATKTEEVSDLDLGQRLGHLEAALDDIQAWRIGHEQGHAPKAHIIESEIAEAAEVAVEAEEAAEEAEEVAEIAADIAVVAAEVAVEAEQTAEEAEEIADEPVVEVDVVAEPETPEEAEEAAEEAEAQAEIAEEVAEQAEEHAEEVSRRAKRRPYGRRR